MKKTKLLILFMTTILLIAGCKASDGKAEESLSRTSLEIGTVVTITLYDTSDETIMDGVFDILRQIDNEFSLTSESSLIQDINENAAKGPVPINEDIKEVIETSLRYSELSNGVFDISVEPLVSLWGIGTEAPKLPSQDEIDEAISKIDYRNITLEDGSISFESPDTKLDLGAIAKGYAADKIVKYLKDQNIERAIINLGGNVYALGHKSEDSDWRIGIQDPNADRGGIVGSLAVSNKSVVTSGLYERYFEKDGVRYHHILNANNGYPIENELLGVSILSDKSIDGDALSTITFILGLEEGIDFIENIEGIEAIFITKDSDIYLTSGIKDEFKLLNNDFKIVN